MIALDTNVLVRFLVADDPVQTAKATRLLERTIARGDALFVSDVVLCEVVWVLSASYSVGRDEIVAALHRLLQARSVVFASREEIHRAVEAFARGRGDFADYVIREHARSAGCEHVVTFDRALLAETGFAHP